jgi:DNA-binding transcriptional ArsR family regulator
LTGFLYLAKLRIVMDAETRGGYERRAKVIKALAHPSRLLILDVLAVRKLCVKEITELVGSEMPTVSRHLSILKNAGVLQERKHGSSVYYSLRIPCTLNFFKCADAVIEATSKQQKATQHRPAKLKQLFLGA